MTDIVERLRALSAALLEGEFVALTETVTQSADEIMQLRQQVKDLRAERDSIRRTFCFIIASGNLNARDGNTAFRIGAEHVAELNHWKCFEENN